MAPDPDCLGLNLVIMGEVIATVLLQAALLGVVFARFRCGRHGAGAAAAAPAAAAARAAGAAPPRCWCTGC